MRTLCLAILLLPLLYLSSMAQSTCTITDTLFNADRSVAAGVDVWVKKVEAINGASLLRGQYSRRTNSSGIITLKLSRNSLAWIYCDLVGMRGDNNEGQKIIIPNTATANLGEIASASAIYAYDASALTTDVLTDTLNKFPRDQTAQNTGFDDSLATHLARIDAGTTLAETQSEISDSSKWKNVGSGLIQKDATQRIGIGTETPANRIHVYKDTAAIIRVRLENPSAAAASVVGALFEVCNDNGYWGGMGMTGSGSTIAGGIYANTFHIYGDGYAASLYTVDGNQPHIWNSDVGDNHNFSFSEIMRLTAAGALRVTGDITFSGGKSVDGVRDSVITNTDGIAGKQDGDSASVQFKLVKDIMGAKGDSDSLRNAAVLAAAAFPLADFNDSLDVAFSLGARSISSIKRIYVSDDSVDAFTGSINIDASTGNVFRGTTTGNTTATITNMVDGQVLSIVITQGASHTFAFVGLSWAGGTAPVLTTGANARDVITIVQAGGVKYGTFVQDMQGP